MNSNQSDAEVSDRGDVGGGKTHTKPQVIIVYMCSAACMVPHEN